MHRVTEKQKSMDDYVTKKMNKKTWEEYWRSKKAQKNPRKTYLRK